MIAVLLYSRLTIESTILRGMLPHYGGLVLWRT
jgi:hypothetical protein